jgi:hypothetical protein
LGYLRPVSDIGTVYDVPSIRFSSHPCLIIQVASQLAICFPSHSLTNMQPTRQDELRELQDQLVRLDAEDSEENPLFLQSRKLDDAQEGSIRRALIQEIDDKLKEYGKI